MEAQVWRDDVGFFDNHVTAFSYWRHKLGIRLLDSYSKKQSTDSLERPIKTAKVFLVPAETSIDLENQWVPETVFSTDDRGSGFQITFGI